MDFRAKDGIFHAFVRFFIGISSLTPYCLQQFFTGIYNKAPFENRI